MGCENISHFYECIEEIKESFIYKEESQSELFILLCEYLVFNHDQKSIEPICEIIQITFLKAPIVLREMEENGSLVKMYQEFKVICKRD